MSRRAAQRKREAQRRKRVGIAVGAAVAVIVVAVVAIVIVSSGSGEDAAPDGRALFAANCATCHGERGEGLFTFPPLAGVVETKYPNVGDQIAVVANGRNEMPAFGDKLSPEEIRAVVDFTRTLR